MGERKSNPRASLHPLHRTSSGNLAIGSDRLADIALDLRRSDDVARNLIVRWGSVDSSIFAATVTKEDIFGQRYRSVSSTAILTQFLALKLVGSSHIKVNLCKLSPHTTRLDVVAAHLDLVVGSDRVVHVQIMADRRSGVNFISSDGDRLT